MYCVDVDVSSAFPLLDHDEDRPVLIRYGALGA